MASSFAAQLIGALEHSWPAIARPNQLPPPGKWWQIWLLLAGRGLEKLAPWQSGCATKRHLGKPAGLPSSPPRPLTRATFWLKEKAAFSRSRRPGSNRSTSPQKEA